MELSRDTALILGLTPVALVGVMYLAHCLKHRK